MRPPRYPDLAFHRPARLARLLAVVTALFIIYASLYPLSGWRDSGMSMLAWLGAPWPRWWTWFDFAVNIIAYLPLGFFWASDVRPRRGFFWAVILATLDGVLLSLIMESGQQFLPSRVPSNLDWAGNALGAVIGALVGAGWGWRWIDAGRLGRWRNTTCAPGFPGDAGLLLFALWLLTQLAPENMVFGNGELRHFFAIKSPLDFNALQYPLIESAVVGGNSFALMLMLTCLMPRLRRLAVVFVACLLLTAGLALKSVALSLSLGQALAWASHGSLLGLAAGFSGGIIALLFPRGLHAALAASALLLAAILVNFAPDNPYLINTWQSWSPGQLLNFYGVTTWLASAWPFFALFWVMLPNAAETHAC